MRITSLFPKRPRPNLPSLPSNLAQSPGPAPKAQNGPLFPSVPSVPFLRSWGHFQMFSLTPVPTSSSWPHRPWPWHGCGMTVRRNGSLSQTSSHRDLLPQFPPGKDVYNNAVCVCVCVCVSILPWFWIPWKNLGSDFFFLILYYMDHFGRGVGVMRTTVGVRL